MKNFFLLIIFSSQHIWGQHDNIGRIWIESFVNMYDNMWYISIWAWSLQIGHESAVDDNDGIWDVQVGGANPMKGRTFSLSFTFEMKTIKVDEGGKVTYDDQWKTMALMMIHGDCYLQTGSSFNPQK